MTQIRMMGASELHDIKEHWHESSKKVLYSIKEIECSIIGAISRDETSVDIWIRHILQNEMTSILSVLSDYGYIVKYTAHPNTEAGFKNTVDLELRVGFDNPPGDKPADYRGELSIEITPNPFGIDPYRHFKEWVDRLNDASKHDPVTTEGVGLKTRLTPEDKIELYNQLFPDTVNSEFTTDNERMAYVDNGLRLNFSDITIDAMARGILYLIRAGYNPKQM